jgi:hypothetical protein
MAAGWARDGYQRVEKRRIRTKQPGGAGTGAQTGRYLRMLNRGEQCREMRALAAQLRDHAAETALEMFKRKFEKAATELEEAARDSESPQLRLAN